MATFKENVVYTDPINPSDVLTAHPATNGGVSYGTIGTVFGTEFNEGSFLSHRGSSQSICVETGKELEVLTALGNKLLGLETDTEDHVVVTTVTQLERLRNLIVSKRSDEVCLAVKFAINDLIDLLNGPDAARSTYTKEEVQVALAAPVPAHS